MSTNCNDNNTPVTPVDLCHECEEQKPCCEQPDYDDDGCVDTIKDKCVTYDGIDIPCTDIKKGWNLRNVITKLADMIKSIYTKFTSNSLVVTRTVDSNNCSTGVNIELVPSTDVNNQLILGTDGRPFSKPTVINVTNTNCLSWTKTVNGNITTLVPILDMNCLTAQICKTCADQAPVLTCVQPTNLHVAQQLQVNGLTTATFTWTSVGGVVYNDFLNGVSAGTNIVTPHPITNLLANTTYTYLLEAVCANGAKNYSAVTFTTSSLTSCGAPTNLNVIMN